MRLNRNYILSSCGTILVFASIVFGGPTDPPPGPIASTYKTLTEVEPRIAVNAINTPSGANSLFRITQPGSYYLTDNVVGVGGKIGVEIAASDVTLDLMGFSMQGASTDAASASAIVATSGGAAIENVTIRNGTIRGWKGDGIDLFGLAVKGCRIEGVTVEGTGRGIRAGLNARIDGCIVRATQGTGIQVGAYSTVTDCVADGVSEGADGFAVGSFVSLSGCVASGNAGAGFRIQSGCVIDRCTAADNSGDGFNTWDHCVIGECSSSRNDGVGFFVQKDSTIRNCVANSNGGDGIQCGAGTIVLSNLAEGSLSGAGIHVTGPQARVEAK